MKHPIQLSLKRDGSPLRVTKETARTIFFDVFRFSLQEKFDLEMPQNLWRSCGMGLIDHLHKRCTHDDLSEVELRWLERGLNLLLKSRGYRLFREEGVIEKTPNAPRNQGLYLRLCGAHFLLTPMPKERIVLDGPQPLVREDINWGTQLIWYHRVKTMKGKLCIEMSDFFESSRDVSLPLFDFQNQTRRLYQIVKVIAERGCHLTIHPKPSASH